VISKSDDHPFDERDLAADPGAQFRTWYSEAEEAGVALAETAVLATATAGGAPSARAVLVKGAGDDGFLFFTNYESRKGRELAENPRAALVFLWQPLGRQVRVEGTVERVSEEESAAYFATRAPGSQLGAWASPQSSVLTSRESLERRVADTEERFADGEIPVPPHWGGFRLTPDAVEFWQHRENRLHDRLRYRRGRDGDWLVERLAP
jgi:pyridoxamine 5'-phosphate oxidase